MIVPLTEIYFNTFNLMNMNYRRPLLQMMLVSALCFSTSVLSAQTINKKFQDQPLKTVLTEIENQTGFSIIYNRSDINEKKIINEEFNDTPIVEVLKKILGPNVSVQIKDKMIIISKEQKQQSGRTKTITGTVLDTNGLPVIGATIMEKGTTNGAITDIDGNYTLKDVDTNSTIVISYIGFRTVELAASDNKLAKVTLAEDSKTLNEVVVIGYGTQSKAKVTGAISRVSASKLVKDVPVTSFDEALAGKLPGVNISQSTGAPGAGINIKIRGTSSINYGGHPLIVVDGLPLSNSVFDETLQGESTISNFQSSYTINPMSSINPSDIESIDVLKDAASTAIYGSRGSNGVIMITTKKGKIGKPTVNFNAYAGAQKLSKKVDVMDAYELANYTKLARDLAWEAVGGNINDPLSVRTGANYVYPEYMIPYIEGKTGLTNTDWQDEIYRTAAQQNYDLSIGGGTEDLRYYISGNYMNQRGIIINSGMKRYAVRANIDANITKKLRFGLRMNVSQTDNDLVQSEGAWGKEGIVITALMYHPNLPAYNSDGSIATDLMLNEINKGVNIATLQNPIAMATMETNTLRNRSFIGNTDLEYTIIDGLKVKTAFGIESIGLHRNFYRPKSLSHFKETAPTKNFNYGMDSRASIFNWISETSINYDKNWNEHNLNLLGNFSVQKETTTYSLLEGLNYPNDNVETINGAATSSGSSFSQAAAMASFLGRAMYSYKDKYMLTASLRYDGSSRFAPNSRWGWFPSISGGWNISQENFYPQNALVNNLKFRASYGITGNAEIPYYGGVAVLAAHNYTIGKEIALGFSPSNSPNKDLSWESTGTVNIGIDAGLWNNKVQVSLDAYKATTKDLLLNVTVPATSGLTSALQNIGKVQNEGLEMSISTYHEFNKDWKLDVSLSMSTNRNKVLALGKGQDQILYSSGLSDPSFIVKVGEPIGSFYGYKVLGIFESQEQFDSTPHLENANQGVGDFIYADTNNDGKVDESDRVILGNANPDFTWGLNGTLGWKDWDFNFGVEGKHGQQVFNATHRYLAEAWGNNLSVYLDEDAPRPVWAYGTKSHTRPSSWHVENASFVRIRNLTLGYTFKELAFLQRMRVYVSVTNPFTFTGYSGYNPEVSNSGTNAITAGEDFGNYPVSKSFVGGINITF